jgi:hypothetical protein
MTLPISARNKSNSYHIGPLKIADGETMKVNVRWDDTCGNGHNTFAVTCDIYKNGRDVGGGADHKTIIKYVPGLESSILYHLVSASGPMHYIANSMYWADNGNLEYARSSAVWPEAEFEDFTEEKLSARLPELMDNFKDMIEELGFKY